MIDEDIHGNVLKTTIKHIADELKQENGNFYLPSAQVVFDTLLLHLSKIMELLHKVELTDDLLKTIRTINSLYGWLISRINPKTLSFAISDVEELRQVQEQLIPLIEKISMLLYLPDPSDFNKTFDHQTKEIRKAYTELE